MPQDSPVDDRWMVADGDFAWGGSPSGPAIEPSSARRSVIAPLMAATAIAAVIAIALAMASGGGTPARPGGPVALAAAVTSGEAGFHVDLAITVSIGGKTVDIDGSGSVSQRDPLSGTLTIDAAGTTINEIVLAPYVYVQLPGSSSGWFRASLRSVATDENPSQTLATLRAAGSVARVGSDELGGVLATRYHAVIDLGRVADSTPPAARSRAVAYANAMRELTGSSDLPMDVWIDAHNHVRRISLDVTGCTREGALSESVRIDYSDFGPQPAVSAPPAGEVSPLPGGLPDPTAQLQSVSC
jgi:hypothetical protein